MATAKTTKLPVASPSKTADSHVRNPSKLKVRRVMANYNDINSSM